MEAGGEEDQQVQEDLAAELATMGSVTKCFCDPMSIFLGSNS